MSSAYASQIPKLIPTEWAGPKAYIRMVFPMELGDNYDMDKAFNLLKAGLDGAKERIPTLGCEGVPDPDRKPAGALKLQKADDGFESITAKDLRDPAVYPHTYAELKAKGFPNAAFPGEVFCRRFTWPMPGERHTVLEAQANFIRGGLVLTCSFHHAFGDGKTYYTICETWAAECRRISGEKEEEDDDDDDGGSAGADIPDVFFTDREKVMQSSGRNAGRAEDHSEYAILDFTPPGMPPKMISPEHVGQVFYVPARARAELKALAQPSRATEVPADVPWVSSNDSISALMWLAVMRAQFGSGEGLEGEPTSIYNIAVDCRLRTDPPIHPRTLGNFLGWTGPTLPLKRILASGNLADVAVAIRRGVALLDKDFMDDLSALFEKSADVDRIVAAAFLDVPGTHLVQSSWINFPLYNLDWSSALGHHAQAVRSPDIGIINGGCCVLPVLPDGGIEIILGVEKSCLPKLLADPFLRKYAEPRLL